MTAQVIRLDDVRPGPDQAEAAYETAMAALRAAQRAPSINNMAVAIDAWREFERRFLGRIVT